MKSCEFWITIWKKCVELSCNNWNFVSFKMILRGTLMTKVYSERKRKRILEPKERTRMQRYMLVFLFHSESYRHKNILKYHIKRECHAIYFPIVRWYGFCNCRFIIVEGSNINEVVLVIFLLYRNDYEVSIFIAIFIGFDFRIYVLLLYLCLTISRDWYMPHIRNRPHLI